MGESEPDRLDAACKVETSRRCAPRLMRPKKLLPESFIDQTADQRGQQCSKSEKETRYQPPAVINCITPAAGRVRELAETSAGSGPWFAPV